MNALTLAGAGGLEPPDHVVNSHAAYLLCLHSKKQDPAPCVTPGRGLCSPLINVVRAPHGAAGRPAKVLYCCPSTPPWRGRTLWLMGRESNPRQPWLTARCSTAELPMNGSGSRIRTCVSWVRAKCPSVRRPQNERLLYIASEPWAHQSPRGDLVDREGFEPPTDAGYQPAALTRLSYRSKWLPFSLFGGVAASCRNR